MKAPKRNKDTASRIIKYLVVTIVTIQLITIYSCYRKTAQLAVYTTGVTESAKDISNNTLYAGTTAQLFRSASSSKFLSPLYLLPEVSKEPIIALKDSEPCVVTQEDVELVRATAEEVEEELECPNRWNITLTPDEYILFAKLVFRESGDQCIEGQEAVAEVILNRMYVDYYPDTLYEVLSQPHQFEAWAVRNKGTVTEKTYQACDNVLQGKTNRTPSFDYIAFSRGGHSNHPGSFRIEDHQFCTK